MFFIYYYTTMPELTLDQKLDKILKEITFYKNVEKQVLIKQLDIDEYKDVAQYKFLDKVYITEWFYMWVYWTIVTVWEAFPETIDDKGNTIPEVVKSYWVLISNHKDEEITVTIDAKHLMLN